MKSKIGFVVDSTFGIKPTDGLKVNPLLIHINGVDYVDGNFDYNKLIEALQAKQHVKTSQPTPDSYMNLFKELISEGYEHIICLTLSKTLSGTFNSANLAKSIFGSDNIHVVDTESTINASGYIAEKALEYSKEHSLEETLLYINQLIDNGSVIFTVDNLDTLVRNGRLSRVKALIGNILKVKPILRFKDNVLELEHKVRSFGNVIRYITEQAAKLLDKAKVIVRIAYIDRTEYSERLYQSIHALDGNIDVKITGTISPVVAAHVGLGALGIYLAFE